MLCLALGLLLVGAQSESTGTPGALPFAATDAAALGQALPALAERLLAAYAETNRPKYLDNRFRLEIVAGHYAEAAATLAELRSYDDRSSPRSDTNYSQYAIFVAAERLAATGLPFDRAFARAFSEAVDPLDDRRAAYVIRRFKILGDLRSRVDADLAAQRGSSAISLRDGVRLVHDFQLAEMYGAVAPYTQAAIERDDRRRYTIDSDVLIETPSRTHVCAFVVRPRGATRPLPTLLEYSIYADRRVVYDDARLSAAYGYAGVRAYTPGKGCSSDPIVAYEYEGSNADAAIAWIARQAWSDGRVGMYGGSYNSFAEWAAAKAHPRALRAHVVGFECSGHRYADGRERFRKLGLSVAALHNGKPLARREQRRRSVGPDRARKKMVRQRQGLPRDGPVERGAESSLGPLARPSQLRRVLAAPRSVQSRVCADTGSSTVHRRVPQRSERRRILLFFAVPAL